MKRRTLMSLLGGAAFAPAATARAQARAWRLGILTPALPFDPAAPPAKFLLDVLAQHGYRAGDNLVVTTRGARGQQARLPALIEEFKAERVDVLVTGGYPPTLAAKQSGIPTVGVRGVGDPVATGLVESLARPGGTVTGISDDATMLSIKRLSLLKELSPKLAKVAMLWNRDDLGMSLRYKASSDAAQSIGVAVQALGVREPDDFDGVFEAMKREPPDAILMVSDSLTMLNRKRVIEYAAAQKLPAIYEYDALVREGGLMSYGGDDRESFERAAVLVERIFKGARPAELPFEQPTRYPFVINLKTAKAIGLTIPPALLARADDVIE
jgi:putative tryptophan/tyrosine transport system substrate-binding protein